MNRLGTLEDSLTVLDFDHVPACEGKRDGNPCDRHAVWFGYLNCCGFSKYSCEWHRQYTDDLLAENPRRCHYCKGNVTRVRWSPINA